MHKFILVIISFLQITTYVFVFNFIVHPFDNQQSVKFYTEYKKNKINFKK